MRHLAAVFLTNVSEVTSLASSDVFRARKFTDIPFLSLDVELNTSSPLSFAISTGLGAIVDELLLHLESGHRYAPDGDLSTCLFVAASVNNFVVVRRLLDLGAEVDVPKGEKQLTPLHAAAENGCDEVVTLLLQHGASPHARSDSESTPFYRAARNGSIRTLRLLLEAGSELDSKTWDSWTPLMEAVENEQQQAVVKLLEWGADPAHISSTGDTPLSLAYGAHQRQHLVSLISEALSKRGVGAGAM